MSSDPPLVSATDLPNTPMSPQQELAPEKLEAAKQQKIANLKLKSACFENERLIQEFYSTEWSESQRKKFASAHGKAHELISEVEKGTRYAPTQSFTAQRFVRQFGLELHPKDLANPQAQPQLEGIRTLRSLLAATSEHPNKTKVVNFEKTIAHCQAKLDLLEEEFTQSNLDSTDIAEIPLQVINGSQELMDVQPVAPNLQNHEEEIRQIKAKIQQVKEIRDVALSDGEMAIAEEQFYLKAKLLEQLVSLIRDKFRVLSVSEEENRGYRHLTEGPKKCFQLSAPSRDREKIKRRKCNNDLAALTEIVKKLDLEDAEGLRQHAISTERSDRFLRDNENAQSECWKQIQDLERQLQRLGTERFEEVRKRLEETDIEERRKTDYAQLIEAANAHRQRLELTGDRADGMMRGIGHMEDLVSELGAGIKARYSKCTLDLGDERLAIHQEYLEAFERLYRTLGQIVYKKEKRIEEIDEEVRTAHIQLEFAVETFDPNAKKHSDHKKSLYDQRAQVEQDIQALKDQMAGIEEDFAPTAEALTRAGIEFTHPANVVSQRNLERRTKIVEYRTHLQKAQEMRLQQQKEEVKRAKESITENPASPGALRGPPLLDPYSPPDEQLSVSQLSSPGSLPRIGSGSATSPGRYGASAPPTSPQTGNPRRVDYSLSSIGSLGSTPKGPSAPRGMWASDVLSQVIYYNFLSSDKVEIDFRQAGLAVQTARYALDFDRTPATIDIILNRQEYEGEEATSEQTQRMLFRWNEPDKEFQLQMNSNNSIRPAGFHEGTSVTFVRA